MGVDKREEDVTEHISDETLAAFLDGTIGTDEYLHAVMHVLACETCYRLYVDASKILMSLREEGE